VRLLVSKGANLNAKNNLSHSTIMCISQKRADSDGPREQGGDEGRPLGLEALSKLQVLFWNLFLGLDSRFTSAQRDEFDPDREILDSEDEVYPSLGFVRRLGGCPLNQKEKQFIHIWNKYPERKEGRYEEFAEGKRGRENN
jgi:hypothetical protein